MQRLIHLGIAEDHVLVRQGMVNLLKEYDDLNVLFDVGNGKELIDELKNSKPDIILLDIEMPVMNGKEAMAIIKEKYPQIKIIVISSHFEDSYIIEFITNGACGFLPKNIDIDQVVDAIHSVYSNGYYFDGKVSAAMAQTLINNSQQKEVEILKSKNELTAKEVKIIELMCNDKTTREIAEEMNLSPRTIEGYRKSIMDKTQSNGPLGLVNFAIKHNIVPLPK